MADPATAVGNFHTAAEVWLIRKEAEILNGEWIDPDSGKVPFAEYAWAWIEEQPNLRPKTIRLYRYLLRAHLQPAFGSMTVAWRARFGPPKTDAVMRSRDSDGRVPRGPSNFCCSSSEVIE